MAVAVFLTTFNGISFIPSKTVAAHLLGDACLVGGSGFNSSSMSYFQLRWSEYKDFMNLPIHILEFWCMILQVRLWGESYRGQRIALWTDNQACFQTVTKMRPHDETMKELCREFLYWTCFYKLEVEAMWISTHSNVVADFLSRNFNESEVSDFFAVNNLVGMRKLRINPKWLMFSFKW